jgi:GAF domain-containing protein
MGRMSDQSKHLERLDRAAMLAYEESMGRTLDDPGRLRAAYSARFAAEPVRERIRLICETARAALLADGCEANLITESEQIDIVSDQGQPVAQGFCRFVVSERNTFGVTNAVTHSLVCATTAVTERGLRSYLGLPLLWDDYAVGAFCVWSKKPREWQSHEVQVLAGFAVAVVDTMSWDKQ